VEFEIVIHVICSIRCKNNEGAGSFFRRSSFAIAGVSETELLHREGLDFPGGSGFVRRGVAEGDIDLRADVAGEADVA